MKLSGTQERRDGHPADSELSPADLASRWFTPDPLGDGTQRDVVLRALRAGQGPGEAPDLRGIDLKFEDLSGLNLSRADLSGADLSGAILSGADLSWSQLVGTNLFGADLTDCELTAADMTGANLSECQAERAGLGGATLEQAKFFGANLAGATLSQAQAAHVDLRGASLNGARVREAELRQALLSRADLRGADLADSRVSGADFYDADLRGALLKGLEGYGTATWIRADIRDVDFCGAYMVRRHIMDENYLHEFRRRSRATEWLYKIWWLTSDCGRSFTRWALWIVLVAAIFGALYQFVAIDYGDHKTPLSSLYYSVVTLTTLGYGDVLPASVPAQLLAVLEVTLGYIALGGLLSIFANKMARRAD